MMIKIFSVFVSASVLSLGIAVIPAVLADTKPISLSQVTLDNFYQVADSVYRSEQPTAKEMKQLESAGIKTVINLRLFHSDEDEAQNTSLNLVRIPMRAGKIHDNKMIEILRAIKTSPKPVLIHCWHGSDRTGVAVAMYRMIFENWTREAAIDELMKPEYGHHAGIYDNIRVYLQHVDIDKIKNKVFE